MYRYVSVGVCMCVCVCVCVYGGDYFYATAAAAGDADDDKLSIRSCLAVAEVQVFLGQTPVTEHTKAGKVMVVISMCLVAWGLSPVVMVMVR